MYKSFIHHMLYLRIHDIISIIIKQMDVISINEQQNIILEIQ